MKQLLLLGSILLIALTGKAQIINHPESFDGYGWGKKSNSSIVLSAGKYSESYIINYDLSNGSLTYLNDSNNQRLNNFVMIGDTGFATTGTGSYQYTTNNWQSFTQSAIPFDKIITTNSGFFGRKKISTSTGEYYHSPDGNTWSLVKTTIYSPISYKDGKTWIVAKPSDLDVSTDGGLTFTNKKPVGASSSNLSEFIPLDALTGIGIVSASSWFYTTNGGDSWTAFSSFPTNATFVYAPNINTIYANFTTTGLKVSVDKGLTWQASTIPMPKNTPARLHEVGNYLVSQISWNGQFATYFSEGIGLPWTQLQQRVTRTSYNDVSFYNNKGIIVGNSGNYSYTHDRGKTYTPSTTALGTQDLKACEVFNETLMVVGDRQSNIYVSNDAGLTWNKRYSNGVNLISRKFRASADLSTIVLFRNGQNLISKDQGVSWNILGSLGGSFDGTVTASGKLLIVSGANILEMNKTNGSTTTVQTITEPNIQGVILEMVDDNTGYIIATNSTDSTTLIFKTTDGWSTYAKVGTINSLITVAPNPNVPSFTVALNLSLHLAGPNNLYINRYNTSDVSVSNNTIYKSSDGGASWTTELIVPYKQGGSTDKMQGMHYFSAETFVSVWEDGRIVQNTPDNTPLSVAEKNFVNQSVLVFPNPASTVITIQSSENMEQVQLVDMNGKLMRTQDVKSQQHQLNIADLPSGMYFLKIKTEHRTEIKKILKQD
ncbi:T9SS type A sorting domain-containing protein [Flavobacterium faecale]|uniref:T9SS type A sorting domain-containing protein n=1 Tax=Flavobacterium faecale TaxID=1355330 RepID=UPI003AAD00EA